MFTREWWLRILDAFLHDGSYDNQKSSVRQLSAEEADAFVAHCRDRHLRMLAAIGKINRCTPNGLTIDGLDIKKAVSEAAGKSPHETVEILKRIASRVKPGMYRIGGIDIGQVVADALK